jgi:hypothetical protein
MGATSRAATANRSIKVHHLVFSKLPQSFSFLDPFVLFLLATVLSVLLRLKAFEYIFGIFKIFIELILFSKQLSCSSLMLFSNNILNRHCFVILEINIILSPPPESQYGTAQVYNFNRCC